MPGFAALELIVLVVFCAVDQPFAWFVHFFEIEFEMRVGL